MATSWLDDIEKVVNATLWLQVVDRGDAVHCWKALSKARIDHVHIERRVENAVVGGQEPRSFNNLQFLFGIRIRISMPKTITKEDEQRLITKARQSLESMTWAHHHMDGDTDCADVADRAFLEFDASTQQGYDALVRKVEIMQQKIDELVASNAELHRSNAELRQRLEQCACGAGERVCTQPQ